MRREAVTRLQNQSQKILTKKIPVIGGTYQGPVGVIVHMLSLLAQPSRMLEINSSGSRGLCIATR